MFQTTSMTNIPFFLPSKTKPLPLTLNDASDFIDKGRCYDHILKLKSQKNRYNISLLFLLRDQSIQIVASDKTEGVI